LIKKLNAIIGIYSPVTLISTITHFAIGSTLPKLESRRKELDRQLFAIHGIAALGHPWPADYRIKLYFKPQDPYQPIP